MWSELWRGGLMLADDWSILRRATGLAIAVGAAVGGIVGTLLLWLEGLEGGDL